jgi:hypothetical protein
VTTFPGSPRLLKAGLVLLDAETLVVQRIITLQYSPDTLTRTLQVQAANTEATQDRSQALRLKGPPVETFRLEAEIDATDQLEVADGDAVSVGIHPQLAALETMVYPTSADLLNIDALARAGALEVAPTLAPLTLLVWSRSRTVPVRVTDLSVTEEAFDPALNPIRAKVSLSLRVLNVNDLGFGTKGGSVFLAYQQLKERLADRDRGGTFDRLGIGGVP